MSYAFNHILRSEGKNPELWNIATDGVINQFLKRDGLKMAPGGVDMVEAVNYDAEQLYEKLLQEKQQRHQQQSSSNSGQQQSAQQDQTTSSNDSQNQNQLSQQQSRDSQNQDQNQETQNQQSDSESQGSSNEQQNESKNQSSSGSNNSQNQDQSDNEMGKVVEIVQILKSKKNKILQKKMLDMILIVYGKRQ